MGVGYLDGRVAADVVLGRRRGPGGGDRRGPGEREADRAEVREVRRGGPHAWKIDPPLPAPPGTPAGRALE